MRVAFSTILSVSFAASALAIPMGKKRHEEVDIKTECTTVFTTVYATVDPTSSPAPTDHPAGQDVNDSYGNVYPEWRNRHTKSKKPTTSPPPPPAPEQTTPPAPEQTTPPAPEQTTPPVVKTEAETTPPPPPPVPTTTPTTTSPPPPPPVATPTPTPTAAPPANDGTFEGTVLAAHNEKRARHGAPPLTYDSTLASFAKGVSGTCVFKHSGGPYGENLAAGYATSIAAIQAWYDEEKDYNYAAGQFGSGTGHFTQMVWKKTQKLGCATVTCNGANGTPGDFLTCNYDTGNVIGQFIENVLPPTSS